MPYDRTPYYVGDALCDAEQRHRDAERAVGDKKAALKLWAAAHDGTSDRAELQRGDAIVTAYRAAQSELERAGGALDEIRKAAAEEADWQRANLPENCHPTAAADIMRRARGGDSAHDLGSGRASVSSGGPRWVRTLDGRPAVVGRGERFADHEIVREQIARSAERDRHIIGMHGGLGSLIRSMSTTSGSAVVPQVWAADVIDRARNLAAVMQAGAQTVPMDAKTVQIGRLTADPTAGWRAEGSSITASDPTLDNVTLTATTLTALVVGSLEWFQDTTPGGGADQLVTEALAKVIALQIDLAALFGGVTAGAEQTATGNNMLPSGGMPNPPAPRGVLAALLAVASSSVLGGAANGTVQTAATFYKEIIDTIWFPRDFNESPNALIWPSHLARIYAEAVNTLNDPMRVPDDVASIQKFVSNQIPSGFTIGTGTLMSDVFVGDFRQLLIGQRLDLQIQTLTERYAELGQIGILATFRGDVQLARPRAFSVFRYIKGT